MGGTGIRGAGEAAKHPVMYTTAPLCRESSGKMLTVPGLRNPEINAVVLAGLAWARILEYPSRISLSRTQLMEASGGF